MKKKEVKNDLSLDNGMQNSMASLLQGAMAQSNLTSFGPIIQNNIYAPLTINWQLLTYMYKTHGIIQTAIDMPVLDALRGGIELHSGELSSDELKELTDDIEEDGILDTIGEAEIWTRLYGGGGLIINSNQDPSQPFALKGLKKIAFYAANRWEFSAAKRTASSFDFYGHKVDASRVLTLSGKAAPYVVRWQLQGWGMSEVERMVEDFNTYIRTKNVIYELLEEAKIDVWKLKGLNAQLMSAAGTARTRERVQLTNQLKDFNNAVVLDMEDDFIQKQLTFAGLAEMKKENRIDISSALRMPLTKLFGLSASGFNSGEDDIENYNAMVESEVRQKLRRVIRKVLNMLCVVKFGGEFDISFDYRPLRVMSSAEEEQIKTSKQNRIVQLYDRGLVNSKEIGDVLQKEKLVSIDTLAAQGLLEDQPEPPVDNKPTVPGQKVAV